jgi:hypothetical protein
VTELPQFKLEISEFQKSIIVVIHVEEDNFLECLLLRVLWIIVGMKLAVFCDVALCNLVNINQCFREACCLMMDVVSSPETWIIIYHTILHCHNLVNINQCFRGAYCLIMHAVSPSKTLISIYHTTKCNIPEDNHLHACSHENLKSS